MHLTGHHRHLETAVLGEEEKSVVPHRPLHRKSLPQVIRKQFGNGNGIHHRSTDGMGADGSPLVDHGHFQFPALFRGQLHQPDGTGQVGRPAAHKENIEFNGFVRRHSAPSSLNQVIRIPQTKTLK